MTAWGPRLVGRDEPLAALDELRRAALAGEGAVALVTGEAGIGKSALAEAAAARAAADGMVGARRAGGRRRGRAGLLAVAARARSG